MAEESSEAGAAVPPDWEAGAAVKYPSVEAGATVALSTLASAIPSTGDVSTACVMAANCSPGLTPFDAQSMPVGAATSGAETGGDDEP